MQSIEREQFLAISKQRDFALYFREKRTERETKRPWFSTIFTFAGGPVQLPHESKWFRVCRVREISIPFLSALLSPLSRDIQRN